jgi:hypothetical protein
LTVLVDQEKTKHMSQGPSLKERRAAIRRQLTAKGLIKFGAGASIAIRTFDASMHGVGVRHTEPFPNIGMRGRIIFGTAEGGTSTTVQAEVEVRHSVVAQGEYRTGLLFTSLSPENHTVLEGLLKDRPALFFAG